MSKPPNVTVENVCGDVMVMFGVVVHLHFRFSDYRGLQTWKHSDKHYVIHIALANDAKLEAWYDGREKWEAIIAGIVKAVAQ